MRSRRFRFLPQIDVLSLRLAPSASAVSAAACPDDDLGDTAEETSGWNDDTASTDPGAACSGMDDPSATDDAMNDLYGDPMAPQVPDNSVYTDASAVLPTVAFC